MSNLCCNILVYTLILVKKSISHTPTVHCQAMDFHSPYPPYLKDNAKIRHGDSGNASMVPHRSDLFDGTRIMTHLHQRAILPFRSSLLPPSHL